MNIKENMSEETLDTYKKLNERLDAIELKLENLDRIYTFSQNILGAKIEVVERNVIKIIQKEQLAQGKTSCWDRKRISKDAIVEMICEYLNFIWICFVVYCVGAIAYFVAKMTVYAVIDLLFKRWLTKRMYTF